MRKVFAVLVLAVGLLSSCDVIFEQFNGISPVTIVNDSHDIVTGVFITKSSSADLGRSRLDSDESIRPGRSRDFDVEDGIWDIYVYTDVDTDGHYGSWSFTSCHIERRGTEFTVSD